MPRNSYGPDDPESITHPAFAPPEPCGCGRGGAKVTIVTRPGEGGKTAVVGVCQQCANEEGEKAKREVLAGHSARRKAALAWLHGEMVDLYRTRLARNEADAWVTVVDARRAYRRYSEADPNADLRFLGSLFRARGWEKVPGVTAKNTDEGNHARPVDVWRYVGGGS
jgi:hypothetical protein